MFAKRSDIWQHLFFKKKLVIKQISFFLQYQIVLSHASILCRKVFNLVTEGSSTTSNGPRMPGIGIDILPFTCSVFYYFVVYTIQQV